MDRLSLEEIGEGKIIQVTAGEGDLVYRYDFEVLKPGGRPECLITQTNPDGKITGPSLVRLEGTGRWTDRTQNPVQSQERAFTIGHGTLRTGGLVSVIAIDSEEGPNKRFVFEDPPVTSIEIGDAA